MTKDAIRVDRAHCVESGSVMNIFQARDFYFSRQPPRDRLTFQCSDPDCRASKKAPTISGINHHVSLNHDGKYKKPHFRTLGDHIPGCEWAETAEAIVLIQKDRILDPQSPNVCRRFRHAKAGDIIDIFKPVPNEGELDRLEVEQWRSQLVPAAITNRAARIEYRKTQLRKSPHTTSRLELLVHAYLSLTPEEAKATFLGVDGNRVAYSAFFWKAQHWRGFAKTRVNYGMIERVEEDRTYLRILLRDGVTDAAPGAPGIRGGVFRDIGTGLEAPTYPTRIDLDMALLREQRGWRTFAEELGQSRRIASLVYAYGRFELEDGQYVCRPGTLSNLCVLPYKHVLAIRQRVKG